MTIKGVEDAVDALKEGYEFTAAQKRTWLNDCEQQIWSTLLNRYEGFPEEMPSYDISTADTTELLVPEPWSKLYVHYVCAQMCYWAREQTGYMNAKEQYEALLDQYRAEVMRTHRHKPMPIFRGVRRL